MFKEALHELTKVEVEMVSDHAAVRSSAAKFAGESDESVLIVAGGGGGTLRAVIEGICGEDRQDLYLAHSVFAWEPCAWALGTYSPSSLVFPAIR